MSDAHNLFPTTELVGALAVSSLDRAELKEFSADPKGAILANTDVDFADIEIKVIENSSNDVNLTLPYYSEIAKIQAELVKDEKLGEVTGGEILFSLSVFFGTIGVACGIGGFTAAGTAFTTAAVLGGVAISAAVVGTATVAVAGTAGLIAGGIHHHNKKKGKK